MPYVLHRLFLLIIFRRIIMEEEIIFKPSAFKHGIVEEDIRSAFERRVFDYTMFGEEYKNLLIGFARDGNLLEIIYNVLEGNVINVFHAMKCRKAYHDLLEQREQNERND